MVKVAADMVLALLNKLIGFFMFVASQYQDDKKHFYIRPVLLAGRFTMVFDKVIVIGPVLHLADHAVFNII